MIITLSWKEVKQAADMGTFQVCKALEAGMKHRDGSNFAAWDSQITGFLGEMAVSKAMGLPFKPDLNKFRRTPDVGQYEVRSTARRKDPALLVKPADLATRRFLLVQVVVPVCTILGWMRGFDAQMVGLWCPRLYGGAWMVPAARLYPFTLQAQPRQEPPVARCAQWCDAMLFHGGRCTCGAKERRTTDPAQRV